MISFACARCGQKLQAPQEIAGKSVRCSLCKHVMFLAAPVAPAGPVSLPQMQGLASSLARAGLDGGVTVGLQGDAAEDAADGSSGQPSLRKLLNNASCRSERYQVAGELARGGMGVVLRAVDCDIRREVAVKYLLDQSDPRKKTRFIEEAQITGQLEHPNIVPIHELGVDAEQRLFFSMKMVHGRSLAQVLQELREAPRAAEKEYGLGRLLTIFVNICHALAYAHARGVVHRDLKPANIMLGDFGEVYVMDWGLAKVLQRDAEEPSAAVIQTMPSFAWVQEASSAVSSGTVKTNRLDSDDQTIDGTVMGTALYMPPEQARGDLAAIDARSDVYSLGAVLYEMLTLHPPLEKTGGFRAILIRVQNGAIVPPAQREPKRARAGKIPAELAAVAMKALAMRPEDRYPSVESLRGDIERFLEGRSVSVKEDTKREAFLKFVKRNKGFSAGAAAALLVLLLSSVFLLQAWLAAKRSHAAYLREQESKREQARQSVPALVEAARFAVQRRKFDDALAQLNVAVDYDPNNAPARLLKGQLMASRKEFAAARPELERYLKLQPGDKQTAKLARLCGRNRPDDPATVVELADILLRQDLPTLAEGLLSAPEKLLVVYRHKIDSAWPGLDKHVTMDSGGKLSFYVSGDKRVLNLKPLQGMPFRRLTLAGLQIRDLTPLAGMPLTDLNLSSCGAITDLTPLQGLPLTDLGLDSCGGITSLKPLAGMPLTRLVLGNCRQITDLTPLKGMPLTFLDMHGCEQITSLKPLRGMPLNELQMSGCKRIMDLALLNELPLKKLTFEQCPQITDLTFLHGMKLTNVDFGYTAITDLTPLHELPLKGLSIVYSGQVCDLTPLKGMSLTSLDLTACGQVADLSPLRGMPLTNLNLNSCRKVVDLSPLRRMPLTTLVLSSCEKISDLTPLEGMKLTSLSAIGCANISDLTALQGMKLTNLNLEGCRRIADLTPLRGMPLTYLRLDGCEKITDLTPLEGMPLGSCYFPVRTVKKGVDVLRRMTSLTHINEMPATEFWRKYEAGKLRK